MITVEQALIETQKLLREINVPVWLIEQIGLPINSAINNLQACLDAFKEKKQEDEKEPEQKEKE